MLLNAQLTFVCEQRLNNLRFLREVGGYGRLCCGRKGQLPCGEWRADRGAALPYNRESVAHLSYFWARPITTVAEADFVGSAVLTAVTVTFAGEGTAAGAV